MARKSKASKLAFMRNEVERSKQWRKSYELNWKRFIDLYRGRHYGSGNPIQDLMVVNICFATKNVIAPSVAINNPKFIVNPLDEESGDQAVITEEVLNSLWRQHRYQDEIRLAVDDWVIVGHGWVKCVYKDISEQLIIKELDDNEPRANTESPEQEVVGVDDREEGAEGQSETAVTDVWTDRPFPERISPFDMFVDPDARSMKEIRWIAQRVWRAKADVQADERYNTKARMAATSGDRWGDGTGRDSQEKPNSGPHDYVEVIEFYDIKQRTVSTFAMTGQDEGDADTDMFLREPEDVGPADVHPFKMLRNYDVIDEFYPMGEFDQIEPQQQELNEVRTQQLNHRKRFARKYGYNEELFDERGIAALQSDVDGTVVPIKAQSGADMQNAVVALPAISTPPELYSQSDLIQDDINKISGVNDYMRGMPDTSIRRTATEAAMIQDAANARSSDKLVKIESFLCDVAAGVVKLMQQYMTGEAVARIVGLGGQAWITYDRDYIRGNFDYEIEGGSTQPRNESFRRQSAMQLMDVAAPFIGQGILDGAAIARYVLQHGFGIKNAADFMVQQQPMGQPGPEGMPPEGMQPANEEGEMAPGGAAGMAQLEQMLGQIGGQGGVEEMLPAEMM